MSEPAERVVVTSPGVYDLPAAVYHADPVPGGSLSSTGARLLMPPSCPAKYRYALTHGELHSRTFDLGRGAHQLVLETGPEIVPVHAENWRTNAAKVARDDAYLAGQIPLLEHEFEQVQAMALQLRRHPVAAALLDLTTGRSEQSLFWHDPEFGVWRRACVDFLPDRRNGRMLLPEYKSTVSAEPRAITKSMVNYGYDQQADWYHAALVALGLADPDAQVVFIFQEKSPPYLVQPATVSAEAMRWARVKNRKALDVYRRCRDTGVWPGYTNDVVEMELPAWQARHLEEQFLMGAYDTEEVTA